MKRHINNIFAYSTFLILSIAVMSGVLRNISTVMYGQPGDPFFDIWKSWYFKYAFLHNKPFYFSDFLGAPFGSDLTQIPYHLFWDKLFFVVTLISNEVFAYNLFMFLSFFLSGIIMYHLVFYLTRDRAVSIFSGIAYMFCPYHLAHSLGHLGLASIQWLPLLLLFILKAFDTAELKNFALLSLSLLLVFISNYYYGVFSYLIVLVFILSFIIINRVKVTFKIVSSFTISFLIAIILTLIIALPPYLNTLGRPIDAPGSTDITYAAPLKDLFTGSARPLSYLLPSYMHPIFGSFTKLLVGFPLYGDTETEHSLYLGIFPLILSWLAIRRRTKISKLFLILLVATVIFSMPPYIKLLSLKIYLPQFFIFKTLPSFRTFARFGIFAMLCISVLAGFGLKELLRRARNKKMRVLIYAISIAIVLFEFLVNPFQYKFDLGKAPEVYKWLAQEKGDFIICEYPLNKAPVFRGDWLIWQRIHGKRTADVAPHGSYSSRFRKDIFKLQDANTPGILKWLGVKYAIVHLDDMKESESLDIVGILPNFNKQEGLKLVKRFKESNIEIYEVTAKPINPESAEGEEL